MTSFRWMNNSGTVITEGQIYSFLLLTLSDAGRYICKVIENMNYYYNSTNIILKSEYLINNYYIIITYINIIIVYAVPAPTSVQLAIMSDSDDFIQPFGSNVTLICTVELSPAVDVPVTVNTVWTGPAGFMHHNTTQSDMRSNGIYMINTVISDSLKRNQSGNYNCTVTITSNNSFLMTSDSSSNTTRVRVGERNLEILCT